MPGVHDDGWNQRERVDRLQRLGGRFVRACFFVTDAPDVNVSEERDRVRDVRFVALTVPVKTCTRIDRVVHVRIGCDRIAIIIYARPGCFRFGLDPCPVVYGFAGEGERRDDKHAIVGDAF